MCQCVPSDTIYGLFILAADLVFIVMLPQLSAVLLSQVCVPVTRMVLLRERCAKYNGVSI